MSNPIDKYLEKKASPQKTKEAGLGSLLDRAKGPAFNAAVGAGTMGAITAGTAAASFGAKKLYEAVTKKRDFRQMLEHNPDLHEHLERDPKLFNQAYTSLRNVNLQFGSDPLIAGNYMRQIMDAPLSAGGNIENALSAASNNGSPILDATMRGILQGASSGLHRPVDPHAGLDQDVRGLMLQKKYQELTSQDPHADMRRQIEEANLHRDFAQAQTPIMSPLPGPGSRRPPRPRSE